MVKLPAGIVSLRDRFDAVLVDMDGTLLDGSSRLTGRTAAAIRLLETAGFRVLLCTGRSVAGTREVHAELQMTEAVVAYNGSWIGHPDGEPEHYLPICDTLVAHIRHIESHAEFTFRHSNETKYTVASAHDDHASIVSWYSDVIVRPHHDDLPATDLMRVSMFFEGSPASAPTPTETGLLAERVDGRAPHHAVWADLPTDVRAQLRRETFPLRIFPTYRESTLELCEVQAASRGKAEAFDYLATRYEIPPERTIAIGDHQNDLTMHAGAGLAVAMGNAVRELREISNVVIGHHAEEGLAAWIEQGMPLIEDPQSERAHT